MRNARRPKFLRRLQNVFFHTYVYVIRLLTGILRGKRKRNRGQSANRTAGCPGEEAKRETRAAGDEVWKHAVARRRARRLIGQEKEDKKKRNPEGDEEREKMRPYLRARTSSPIKYNSIRGELITKTEGIAVANFENSEEYLHHERSLGEARSR